MVNGETVLTAGLGQWHPLPDQPWNVKPAGTVSVTVTSPEPTVRVPGPALCGCSVNCTLLPTGNGPVPDTVLLMSTSCATGGVPTTKGTQEWLFPIQLSPGGWLYAISVQFWYVPATFALSAMLIGFSILPPATVAPM